MILSSRKRIVLAFAFLASSVVDAEVTSLSLSAKVKSFDQSNVVLESSSGRVFTAARSTIKQKTLQAGQPVLVTLQGDQVKAFESAPKK